jgi:aspartyl protease family protein
VPRAADGHYYLAGAVNGFPVVFMVDTGASMTALPARFARNAGMRAGRVMSVETAAGRNRASASQANTVNIGPFKLTDVLVGIHEQLQIPLLGMDALNRFQISQTNGIMTLRVSR